MMRWTRAGRHRTFHICFMRLGRLALSFSCIDFGAADGTTLHDQSSCLYDAKCKSQPFSFTQLRQPFASSFCSASFCSGVAVRSKCSLTATMHSSMLSLPSPPARGSVSAPLKSRDSRYSWLCSAAAFSSAGEMARSLFVSSVVMILAHVPSKSGLRTKRHMQALVGILFQRSDVSLWSGSLATHAERQCYSVETSNSERYTRMQSSSNTV